jgi:hypothetical protein
MSHDKIKAAARKRMAATGQSYAAARREVIREFQPAESAVPDGERKRFAIRIDDLGPFTRFMDDLLGGSAKKAHVEIAADRLLLRWGNFSLDVPRASVRGASSSSYRTRGTIGMHSSRGVWLVNGSFDGLVEIPVDPPCRTGRGPTSLFFRMEVKKLIVSLVDPDGFIAAVSDWLDR